MSMDAGSLAQMSSYNNLPTSNGLSMPVNSFSSRRGSNIKSLSFDQTNLPPTHDNSAPTPRTSRSHMLAGLRTAPKCSTPTMMPFTAPPNQPCHMSRNEVNKIPENVNYAGPRSSNFLAYQPEYAQVNKCQIYAAPEQILAPPEINIDEYSREPMDPNYYAQLVATNVYLAEQQQRLQQQLINVQAAAQQFQGLSLGLQHQQQQYSTPPVTPQNSYQQQAKNHLQSMGMSVGSAQMPLYSYFNPASGQSTYALDNHLLQYDNLQKGPHSATFSTSQRILAQSHSRGQTASESGLFPRSISPPTKANSPLPAHDHVPLPPPSAGAFRRGHRKAPSLAVGSEDVGFLDSPRSSFLSKGMGFPSACMSGFGPGQGRIGEHPVRQPRGPPSLDELLSKPTTKIEGSKNFATRTRTRRIAVSNLVRAGIERRRAPGSSGSGSASASEIGEVSLSITDNDSDSGRSGSGSLSSRPALGSPRTSIHGAIGSNRPSSRQHNRSLERKSVTSLDSSYTSASVSSDEGNAIGGKFASIFKNENKKVGIAELKTKAPMLILTPADKRKVYV